MSWKVQDSMISWIRENIRVGETIIELGSGDGTTGILCNDYNLYSVEHDEHWIGKYKSHYIHAKMVNGWYDPVIVSGGLPKDYSLLIVDGPIGDNRKNFIRFFDLFRKDVPIVFDDAQRKGESQIIRSLSNLSYKVSFKYSSPDKCWLVMNRSGQLPIQRIRLQEGILKKLR